MGRLSFVRGHCYISLQLCMGATLCAFITCRGIFQRCYDGSDRIDGGVERTGTAGGCRHVYVFTCARVYRQYRSYRGRGRGRGMMMDLAGLMNTAERKCLWFKDTLSKLNKERWHRGGEHESKLHNQLSHKLGNNIPFLLAEYTSGRHVTILILTPCKRWQQGEM